MAQDVSATSFSARDIQVLVRALGFLQPSVPRDAVAGIVFAPGNAASRRDAEQVAALFSTGSMHARPVSADALDNGTYAALVVAAGAPIDKVAAAARPRHIACVTAELSQVESGRCTLWIHSEPRVEIAINRAAFESFGISVAAAFRMMIREI
jgi:hypothetical protein